MIEVIVLPRPSGIMPKRSLAKGCVKTEEEARQWAESHNAPLVYWVQSNHSAYIPIRKDEE